MQYYGFSFFISAGIVQKREKSKKQKLALTLLVKSAKVDSFFAEDQQMSFVFAAYRFMYYFFYKGNTGLCCA